MRKKTSLDPASEYREERRFARREEAVPHASYAYEKQLLHVIRQGRTDELELVMQLPPDGTAGVIARDVLRNAKNMFIAAMTSYTRAAIDGGLSEELAYAMSDGFILHAEECRTAQEVQELASRAAREFTQSVAREGRNRYGAQVAAAIRVIRTHLHEKITLDLVASKISLSPCYLSRKFKEETGSSFVDFVQRERIEAAKQMLIYSDDTLAAISEYLCFSSQSYFVRIFRKVEGMTPGEFRNQHQARH